MKAEKRVIFIRKILNPYIIIVAGIFLMLGAGDFGSFAMIIGFGIVMLGAGFLLKQHLDKNIEGATSLNDNELVHENLDLNNNEPSNIVRIKKLYSELIDNWSKHHQPRDFTVEEWHRNYRTFYNEVASMRIYLNNGGNLDSRRDKDFLMQLIYGRHNGIANAGNSLLSKEASEYLIGDDIFLDTLSDLIKTPDIVRFEKFGKIWRERGYAGDFTPNQISKPLRINRVVAACTDKVSSTVDRECFIESFKILNSFLPSPYKSPTLTVGKMGEREWFQENLYLMSELRKILPASDPLLLSIFVWEIYHHRDNLPA